MTKKTTDRATRLSSDDFKAHLEQNQQAKSLAQQIIDDARAKAQNIVRKAEAQSDENTRRFEELTTDEFRSFIDEDSLRRHAESCVKLMTTVHKIREDHNRLTPWLVSLVDTVTRRVVGEIDPSEKVAAMVRQGIAELNHSYGLTIRVSADDVKQIEMARKHFPAHFEGVEQVSETNDLSAGVMILSCEIGNVEVSFEARLERVLDALANPTDSPKVTE